MARLIGVTCADCAETYGTEASFAAHKTGHGKCRPPRDAGMVGAITSAGLTWLLPDDAEEREPWWSRD